MPPLISITVISIPDAILVTGTYSTSVSKSMEFDWLDDSSAINILRFCFFFSWRRKPDVTSYGQFRRRRWDLNNQRGIVVLFFFLFLSLFPLSFNAWTWAVFPSNRWWQIDGNWYLQKCRRSLTEMFTVTSELSGQSRFTKSLYSSYFFFFFVWNIQNCEKLLNVRYVK